MIKMSIKQLKEERGIKVSQLIRTVAHLKARGRWVYQLLPPKPKETNKLIQLDNELLFARQAPPVESANHQNNNFFDDHKMMGED